ncbi:MAG: hypothetical protein NVSMB31_05070 [Vulcanimicrobiaceae bacterium]
MSFPPLADASVAAPEIERESVTRTLVGSTSALIFAVATERGAGFTANLLAARLGGATSFGAYSLALTTANSIANYAGAGIGLTSTRFAAEYPEGSRGHRPLNNALILVSSVSALAAAALLYLGAGPLACILIHNPQLTGTLQVAALPAGTMIAFECYRGYLVGQRQLSGLLLLSAVMGGGMLALLPAVSRYGARPMVLVQAIVSLCAVLAALLFGFARSRNRRDSLAAVPAGSEIPVARMARRVWSFGLVQLGGIIGLNAAGWWVASLVARSDVTLAQMGVLAVANQLRNMVALAPGMLAQSSYALLACDKQETTSQILGFGTCVAAISSLALGALIIIPLPYLLPHLYGRSFGHAVLAVSLSVVTAIVQMATAPAVARLTILSLKVTGIINAVWAVLVFVLASLLVEGNGATGATAIYLAAHAVSAGLVTFSLRQRESLPRGLGYIVMITTLASLGLASAAWLRELMPTFPGSWELLMAMMTLAALGALIHGGLRREWLPDTARLLQVVKLRMARGVMV